MKLLVLNLIKWIFKTTDIVLFRIGLPFSFYLMAFKFYHFIKSIKKVKQEVDPFLQGAFHFDGCKNIESLTQREYLTLNDWVGYYCSIQKSDFTYSKRNFVSKRKFHIDETIVIAFFCSYYRSHFYEKTIKKYNELNKKIKWVVCVIDDGSDYVAPSGANFIKFQNIQDAKNLVESFAHVIVDADGPLRPTPVLSILNSIDCMVLNYYNLIASGSNKLYDAVVVPKGVDISPVVNEQDVIRLDALGAWYYEKIELNSDIKNVKWEFAIISEQFKFGSKFYNYYNFLSLENRIVFVGLKDKDFVLKKLKEFNWNISNVDFIDFMPPDELRSFLDRNVLALLDVPNYSSGSGTLMALSAGVPTFCFFGEYWISQMAAIIMQSCQLDEFIVNDVKDINDIITSYKKNYEAKHQDIYNNSLLSPYFDCVKFIDNFHEELIFLLNSRCIS